MYISYIGIPFVTVATLNVATWYQFRSYRRTSSTQLRSSTINNATVEIRNENYYRLFVIYASKEISNRLNQRTWLSTSFYK